MNVLLFTSPTCGPCKVLKPILAQLQDVHKFPVRVVEASPRTQAEFAGHGVRSVPTVVVTDEVGIEVARFGGMKPADEVLSFLKRCGVVR